MEKKWITTFGYVGQGADQEGVERKARSGPEQKRVIAKHLREYWFNNGQLAIELNKLFIPVRSDFKKLVIKTWKIEPVKTANYNLLSALSASQFTLWWATFAKYRTFILENNLYLPRLDAPEK